MNKANSAPLRAAVKLVTVTETQTPFVKVVKNLDEFVVTDVASTFTKQVFVIAE